MATETAMTRVLFDEVDAKLLAERQAKRDLKKGARPGDFVRMVDGTLRRFSHDSPTALRSWDGRANEHRRRCCILGTRRGRYFLAEEGEVRYSGGQDFIEGLEIRDTGETTLGEFWFWHHDEPPHFGGGVEFTIPCRLFAAISKGRDGDGSSITG